MKRITWVVLAALIICLSACGRTGWFSDTEGGNMYGNDGEIKGSEGINITSRQRQILRSSGLSNSEIDEIGEKGWTPAMKSYVDVAERVLNELKKKYKIEFMVYGGAVPDFFTDYFTFFAYALEGENAGVRFEVTYGADAEGKPEIMEGYFAVSKSPEVEKYFQDITAEVDAEVQVVALIDGQVGDEYDKNSTLEDVKESGLGVRIRGYVHPDVDEESLMALGEALERRYRETGYRIDYYIYRIIDEKQLCEINSYRDLSKRYPRGMQEIGTYDVKYKEQVEKENIIYDIRCYGSIHPGV